MIKMFERPGCTVIVDGTEYQDKAIGCFNGSATMNVNGVGYRVEQRGFYYTDEEKVSLQKTARTMIEESRIRNRA